VISMFNNKNQEGEERKMKNLEELMDAPNEKK
jgi:hypothetical protein